MNFKEEYRKSLKNQAMDVVIRFYINILGRELDKDEDFDEDTLRKARKCALEYAELNKENYLDLCALISNDKYWK